VHELAGLEVRHLGHHRREQRVGGDVERHAQEDVGAALVELAGEPAFGDVELEQRMAGGQRHARQVRRVPCRHHEAPRVGIAPDLLEQPRDLVDGAAVGRGPRAPLRAVNGAQLALLVRPFVPDADAVLLQVAHVGAALQEPEQLVDDAFGVDLLGREQGEARAQVEAHLVAEDRKRAGAGAVGLARAVLEDVAQQLEVGLHANRF
jgi:hypothetical protein